MNYLSIYNSIIKSAKNQGRSKLKRDNPLYIYYEKHHIIPRCIMKDRNKEHLMNQQWNLVLLTAREHFICHRLLTKITKGTKYYYKMMHAFCAFTYRLDGRDIIILSHRYNTLRAAASKIRSYKNHNLSDTDRAKIGEGLRRFYESSPGTFTGRKHSDETKRILSQKAKTRPRQVRSQESKDKVRNSLLLKYQTDDHHAKDSSWYNNPATGDHVMIHKGDAVPEGYVEGRILQKWYHNPITFEGVRTSTPPEGYIPGRGKIIKRVKK